GYRNWCDCAFGEQEQARYKREDAEAKEIIKRERMIDRLCASEIPMRYDEAKLDQFSGAPINEINNWLAERHENSIFIWGPVGTGKTHLAAALLTKQIEEGRSGLFVAVPDLLDRIRATYSGKQDEDDLLKRVTSSNLIVLLDDFGAERITDWAREKLYQIVNKRYNDCSETIVTSNLDPEQLAKQVGDRIVSRLVGMCRIIKLDGDDRRLKGQ
ncbi:MAG: ATP-binding protein, partial [Dehalococcoidia bacterium]|nr:ATP-binding protein [Dehalococcoidia bacterium]